MKEKGKMHLTFESDNLAVPEIHTNEDELGEERADESEDQVMYDNLAIPEIKIKHKKNSENKG